MEKEIALFPCSTSGHLAPMVELGKTFTNRSDGICVTIFIMELPFESNLDSYIQSLLSNPPPPRMRFVHLTLEEPLPENFCPKSASQLFIDLPLVHKSRVKEFYNSQPAISIAAFVVDIFNTPFADVAAEFGAPSYAFVASNACFLNLMYYLQTIHDYENQDFSEFMGSDVELPVPGFVNPFPAKVLPNLVFDKEIWGPVLFVDIPRKLTKLKGILVNTFLELEFNATKSLLENVALPPIYAVGPVVNLNTEASKDGNDLGQKESIMKWLDDQPPESVLFLCFGSMGTFQPEQVVEIAHALEQSGQRFLWALRKPPTTVVPSEYENFNEVLPEGFLERTKEIGKVIGWAPQVAVLSHPGVGGFISHCGWNSTIESLWFGVPMASWPLYAEQQMNAFMMVKEFGLAVEIKLDYQKDNPITVNIEEIKRGIKQLMEGNESIEIKKKVKEMKEASRKAVVEGGSSHIAVGNFIEEVLKSST